MQDIANNKSEKCQEIPNIIPDYILSMMSGIPFFKAVSYLSFTIYIDGVKPAGMDRESIEARVEGFYGIGRLEGEIIGDRVDFTVTYDDEAVSHGAPAGKTVYSGRRFKEAYIGNFKRIVDGKDADFSENNRFGLKKFDLKKNAISQDAPILKNNYPTNILGN